MEPKAPEFFLSKKRLKTYISNGLPPSKQDDISLLHFLSTAQRFDEVDASWL